MLLTELEEMKQRLDQGVLIHKGQWLVVLDWAITLTKHHEGQKPIEPAGDNDGWIEHTTGKQPVRNRIPIEVKLVCGECAEEIRNSEDWSWALTGSDYDITHYRIVQSSE